jgi:hypothetical protein
MPPLPRTPRKRRPQPTASSPLVQMIKSNSPTKTKPRLRGRNPEPGIILLTPGGDFYQVTPAALSQSEHASDGAEASSASYKPCNSQDTNLPDYLNVNDPLYGSQDLYNEFTAGSARSKQTERWMSETIPHLIPVFLRVLRQSSNLREISKVKPYKCSCSGDATKINVACLSFAGMFISA